MKVLNADLLQAQTIGYPTGGYQPAVRLILTSKDGGTTYDYSSNPTVITNRTTHFQAIWERENDSAVMRVVNSERLIPDDLSGYYVDVGFGFNTASGIRWAAADGAVRPRLWLMTHNSISGGGKDAAKVILTEFIFAGVWQAVLNQQPLRLGSAPYYQDETGLLAGKTIYGCLKYLIETTLTAQTGITFTLDALGDQDDTYINSTIPFPVVTSGSFVAGLTYRIKTVGTTDYVTEQGASANTIGVLFIALVAGTGTGTAIGPPLVDFNGEPSDGTVAFGTPTTPDAFETYGQLIHDLMNLTNTVLRPEAGLAFKVVYPQEDDDPNETYSSSAALGHPFYEYLNSRFNMVPNHVEVFSQDTAGASVVGNWYDPSDYASPPTYSGAFMPVTKSYYYSSLTTSALCDAQAAVIGRQLKQAQLAQRIIIPMDSRVELYDKVSIIDTRGVS